MNLNLKPFVYGVTPLPEPPPYTRTNPVVSAEMAPVNETQAWREGNIPRAWRNALGRKRPDNSKRVTLRTHREGV